MVSVVSQDHLEIPASALALTSARNCKNFILPFEVLIFVFQGLLQSKTSATNIHRTSRSSWKVLAAVWSSYSVENPLAPASEEGNSTMDATSGAIKICKAAVCRSVILS